MTKIRDVYFISGPIYRISNLVGLTFLCLLALLVTKQIVEKPDAALSSAGLYLFVANCLSILIMGYLHSYSWSFYHKENTLYFNIPRYKYFMFLTGSALQLPFCAVKFIWHMPITSGVLIIVAGYVAMTLFLLLDFIFKSPKLMFEGKNSIICIASSGLFTAILIADSSKTVSAVVNAMSIHDTMDMMSMFTKIGAVNRKEYPPHLVLAPSFTVYPGNIIDSMRRCND